MSLLVFEHTPAEDTCMLGTILQNQGHCLQIVRLYDSDPVPPDLDNIDGVISMGGPQNVDEVAQYPWLQNEMDFLRQAHQAQVPIIGVCLGAQLIAAALGGEVAAMPAPEVGWQPIKLSFPGTTDTALAGIGWNTVQFHMHGQQAIKLPPGSTHLASSKACQNQAFKVGQTTYAFQYHFEWDLPALEEVVGDPLVTKAGLSSQQLLQQAEQYYDDYRRLGDRLCESLAMTLFPLNKR